MAIIVNGVHANSVDRCNFSHHGSAAAIRFKFMGKPIYCVVAHLDSQDQPAVYQESIDDVTRVLDAAPSGHLRILGMDATAGLGSPSETWLDPIGTLRPHVPVDGKPELLERQFRGGTCTRPIPS